jgi:hypothetical protein
MNSILVKVYFSFINGLFVYSFTLHWVSVLIRREEAHITSKIFDEFLPKITLFTLLFIRVDRHFLLKNLILNRRSDS